MGKSAPSTSPLVAEEFHTFDGGISRLPTCCSEGDARNLAEFDIVGPGSWVHKGRSEIGEVGGCWCGLQARWNRGNFLCVFSASILGMRDDLEWLLNWDWQRLVRTRMSGKGGGCEEVDFCRMC